MVFDQVRQRRLSDDIVDRLEGMILEGTLTSGQRLPAERASFAEHDYHRSTPPFEGGMKCRA